jgi:hypothetical protein
LGKATIAAISVEMSIIQSRAGRKSGLQVGILDTASMENFRSQCPDACQAILRNGILSLSSRLVRANREVAALK